MKNTLDGNKFDFFKLFQKKMYKLCFIIVVFITQEAKSQYTQIPDSNFEQSLIDFGHDDVLDGQVLTSYVANLTSLTLYAYNITSVEGIEDFTSLTYFNTANNLISDLNVSSLSNLTHLDCSNNQLQNLNVSGLQNLIYLNCAQNQLTNLILNNLPSLSELFCSHNQLTQLNLNELLHLSAIDCSGNQLSLLNVSGLTNLVNINCSVNYLSSIDISSLTSLYALSCGYNQLTSLDASGLPNLHQLYCFENQLINLDLRDCPTINVLYSYANPELTCILVDDVEVAVTTITAVKDSFSQFSTNCNSSVGFTKVIDSQCGAIVPKLNENIYANLVNGAQAYRFKITDLTTNTIQITDRPLRVFQLTNLTNYAYGTTYKVEVAPRVNGIWLAYGLPCEVTTPVVTTQLQSLFCGSTITDLNQSISADIVPYSLGYRFKVTHNASGQVTFVDRPIRSFMISSVPNVQYGQSFSVEVAVKNTNGVYMNFGPICQLYTGAMTKLQNEHKSDFKTIASPNPFDVTTQLYLTTSFDEIIELNIYDVLGRLVETKTILNDNVNPIEIGSTYPSGVYMVLVSQNDELNTLRIVKR